MLRSFLLLLPNSSRRRLSYYRRRNRSPPPPPPPSPAHLLRLTSSLPPRFTAEHLAALLSRTRDPLLCLHLFRWAPLHRPLFRPDLPCYLLTIKKLASAGMLAAMDPLASEALSLFPHSEDLHNTLIYLYSDARLLSRAVSVYRRMRDSPVPACRPTLRTYNLLFSALLSTGANTHINHFYMDNVRCLFKQMVDSGIEPDLVALNSVIKGYVLSLHLNDALRVFHQMGTVYECAPDGITYNWLVHGLCAKGRTRNAMELVVEMEVKGFELDERAGNSLVSALAMGGEVDEAVRFMRGMVGMRREVERLTCGAVVAGMCGQGRVCEAVELVRELRGRGAIDGRMARELMAEIGEEYGDGAGVGSRGSSCSAEKNVAWMASTMVEQAFLCECDSTMAKMVIAKWWWVREME